MGSRAVSTAKQAQAMQFELRRLDAEARSAEAEAEISSSTIPVRKEGIIADVANKLREGYLMEQQAESSAASRALTNQEISESVSRTLSQNQERELRRSQIPRAKLDEEFWGSEYGKWINRISRTLDVIPSISGSKDTGYSHGDSSWDKHGGSGSHESRKKGRSFRYGR